MTASRTRAVTGARYSPPRSPHFAQGRDDGGSASIALVLFALIAMALAAFVIDGGLAISQRERAADIAEQAARKVANDIDIERLRTDPDAVPHIAADACGKGLVDAVVTASGAQVAEAPTCRFLDPQRSKVEVEVTLRYQPMLSGLFFTGSFTVHGKAVAGPENGVKP
jgi:Flp pilus assembly protein TadG